MARTKTVARVEAKTAVAYIRVSTEDQNLGPDAQRASIARWADANGVTIVAEYQDHGISGGAGLDERPGLMSAVNAVAGHGAGYLIVAKRDRLARDIMVAAMVDRLIEREGARIVSADNAGNGDSPEAILLRRMVDVFAEYERAMIKARTKAALAVKKSRNEFCGGKLPYGFVLAADGKTLVADEQQQEVIVQMRSMRDEGKSLRAIALWLTEQGHLPTSGRWHAETVSLVLSRD
jgi:DNA invertase Pin-like site-specific DNA recombinase